MSQHVDRQTYQQMAGNMIQKNAQVHN